MNLTALGNVFTHVPIDYFLIGVVVLAVAVDALRSGTNRACALALALPAALMLSSVLPKAALLGGVSGQFSSSTFHAILLAALFAAAYMLIYRMIGFYGGGDAGSLNAVITGVATAALLLAVWLQIPELQSVWHFSSTVEGIFGEAYRFWWMAGSYIALAFVRS